MNIGIIGVDFDKMSSGSREKCTELSINTHKLFKGRYQNVVVLRTCHRFEVFFASSDLTSDAINILHSLQDFFEIKQTSSLYSFFGYDCFFHLAKVVSGIESKIFGEDEILRQVRRSYERDKDHNKLDTQLHFLFQKCLKIGKDIRSQLEPRKRSPGIPASILSIMKEQFDSLKHKKVLLIGNSMINRKIYGYFSYCTDMSLAIATSGPLKKGSSLPLLKRSRSMFESRYDVIIAASGAPHYLISHDDSANIDPATLLIDLSVPRNIDPKLIEKYTLYNLEGIEQYQPMIPGQEEITNIVESRLKDLVKKYISIFEEKLRKKREQVFLKVAN